MKILVLNGSPRPNRNTANFVQRFKEGAEDAGHQVKVLQVGSMKIAGCIGCEYCKGNGFGECAIKDDMQKVYSSLEKADLLVFASPVYYWSFTSQLQATISRFYATDAPNPKKYAMILTSASDDVYNSILSQYHEILNYFDAVDMGVFTAYGSERHQEDKLQDVYEFGHRL